MKTALNLSRAGSAEEIWWTDGIVKVITFEARETCRDVASLALCIDRTAFASASIKIVARFAAGTRCGCAFATSLWADVAYGIGSRSQKKAHVTRCTFCLITCKAMACT